MKLYIIKHEFDVDGGFGDGVRKTEVVCLTLDKEKAEAFVEKYSDEHVYDKPYDELCCGGLYVEEQDIIDDLSEYSWTMEYDGERHFIPSYKLKKINES